MLEKYVGVKLIEARPASRYSGEGYANFVYPDDHGMEINIYEIESATKKEPGYEVFYPDGYVSWSPKDVFEKAYMRVGQNNTIKERNVNDFIKDYDIKQWGDKTTIVVATLANGFIMSESSSCVDPTNFNLDIGANICKERIQNRVWEMLGFILQSGANGIK